MILTETSKGRGRKTSAGCPKGQTSWHAICRCLCSVREILIITWAILETETPDNASYLKFKMRVFHCFASRVIVKNPPTKHKHLHLRWKRNASVFRHFLAHFPNILAYGLRSSTKKRGGEQKKKTLRGHDTLCEKPDPLNTLGSVADYLRNSRFFRINDMYACSGSYHLPSPVDESGGCQMKIEYGCVITE